MVTEINKVPGLEQSNSGVAHPGTHTDFLVFDGVTPTEFTDIDLKEHCLNPGAVLRLPLTNAEILETGGYGKVLRTVDEVVETKFLPKAKVDQDPGHRSPTTRMTSNPPSLEVDRSDSGGSCSILRHKYERQPRQAKISYLENLDDCLEKKIIYSENFTTIEPAERLVEVAKQNGYSEHEFEGYIIDHWGYYCEDCKREIYFPKVEGGSLNPFLAMEKSKKSSKDLADKLYQFEIEAKVLGRERNGDLVELKNNNLYDLPMELTYPHELNDYFWDLLKADSDKFYRLRERCVELFFDEMVKLEFGEYAKNSELIYWFNHHDWKSVIMTGSADPRQPHFHEHIDLLNVLYDWSGSEEFNLIAEAIENVKYHQRQNVDPNSSIPPHKQIKCNSGHIAEELDWSLSKTKKKLGHYSNLGLLTYDKSSQQYTAEFPLSSPLLRFNPKKLNGKEVLEREIELDDGKILKVKKTRKEHYQDIWRTCIEKVFKAIGGYYLKDGELKPVRLKDPVIHLPDRIISLKNIGQLIHRLKYCNRRPITDLNSFFYRHPEAVVDPEWFDHLLSFDQKRKGSRITKRLSNYAHVEFLSTLKGRLSRLKKKNEEELGKYQSTKDKIEYVEKEYESINPEDLNSWRLMATLEEDISDLNSELEGILPGETLEDMKDLEEKIFVKKSLVQSKVLCPFCDGELSPINDKPDSDTSLLYFDPIVKKHALMRYRRVV